MKKSSKKFSIKIKPEIPKIRVPHLPTKVIPNKKKVYNRAKEKQRWIRTIRKGED